MGDTIEGKGKSVYVNGEKIDEPYAQFLDKIKPSDDYITITKVNKVTGDTLSVQCDTLGYDTLSIDTLDVEQ